MTKDNPVRTPAIDMYYDKLRNMYRPVWEQNLEPVLIRKRIPFAKAYCNRYKGDEKLTTGFYRCV